MYGSLFGLYRDIQHSSGIARTSAAIDSTNERILAMENRMETLELACAGLWELLKERHGYTDEQIRAHIESVDLRDGQLDGKLRTLEAMCPHCQRKLLTRSRKRCSWCGAELLTDPFTSA